MRNILAVLGAAVAVFLVAGYFLDWYKIHPTADHQVTIDVNTNKLVSDVKKEGKEITTHLQETKPDGTPQVPQTAPTSNPPASAPNAVMVPPNGTPTPAQVRDAWLQPR